MHSLWRNTGFVLFADAIIKVSNLILLIWLSNKLGATAVGSYNIGISYMLVATRIVFWGLDQILIRDVSRNNSLINLYAVNFFIVRFLLSCFIFLVLFIFSLFFLPLTYQSKWVIIIISISIFPESIGNIAQASFIAFEKMRYLVKINFWSGLSRILLNIIILLLCPNIYYVAIVYTLTEWIGALLGLKILINKYINLDLKLFNWKYVVSHLYNAIPFLFISFLFVIDNQLDVIILSIIFPEGDIGNYTIASTIIVGLYILPEAFRTALFPIISREYTENIDKKQKLTQNSFLLMFGLSLPMAVCISLLSSSLFPIIFREDISSNIIPIINVLCWTIVVIFPNFILSISLISQNKQKYIAKHTMIGLVINLLLSIVMIDSFGTLGVAISRLVSRSLILLLNMLILKDVILSKNLYLNIINISLLAFFMYISLFLLNDINIIIKILIIFIIYIVIISRMEIWNDHNIFKK